MTAGRAFASRAVAAGIVAGACMLAATAEARAAFPPAFAGTVDIPRTAVAPAIDGTLDDPAWKNAAVLHLTYDLRVSKPADEQTTVYLLSDASYVYVAFEARQRTPVRATQHTDMVGVGTDDEAQIDLWPDGPNGFLYRFLATPNGTHYQYSSENNAFEPEWRSAGRARPGGYVVTMRVPLGVMHATGKGDAWRLQLIRYVAETGTPYVWSYGPAQRGWNDVSYAGTARGLPRATALAAKPRAGVYALVAAAAASAGGPTSRAGADFSLPVIPGTALLGTIHPDFSDVEVDQQTIAPTAFARTFAEVRPFFTQGANFYEYAGAACVACPGRELYTPAIPTPRDGYALEGQRGAFSYAAFDAAGVGRSDTAQALNYTSPDQKNVVGIQRVSASLAGGTNDTVAGMALQHDNLNNLTEYVRYADDAGSRVADGSRAQRYEAGFNAYSPTSSFGVVARKIGASFDPVDGLIAHRDVAGYAGTYTKAFVFASNARIAEVDVGASIDRYHGQTGGLNQSDTGITAALTTRSLFNVQFSAGSSYVALAPGDFAPVSQHGVQAGYHANTSTPTSISFNTGRFGPGRLDSWVRSSTLRVGARGVLTLEADDTDQIVDGRRNRQWLERASFGWQSGPAQSFVAGVRRIVGTPPQLLAAPSFANQWNVSAALHHKVSGGELYLVYGDAAAAVTSPQLVLKWIRYLGAGKGT